MRYTIGFCVLLLILGCGWAASSTMVPFVQTGITGTAQHIEIAAKSPVPQFLLPDYNQWPYTAKVCTLPDLAAEYHDTWEHAWTVQVINPDGSVTEGYETRGVVVELSGQVVIQIMKVGQN